MQKNYLDKDFSLHFAYCKPPIQQYTTQVYDTNLNTITNANNTNTYTIPNTSNTLAYNNIYNINNYLNNYNNTNNNTVYYYLNKQRQ